MSTRRDTPNTPKALILDLMGTCLDWHSSITPTLEQKLYGTSLNSGPADPTGAKASMLALEWRQDFFDEIDSRFEAGEPPEDIDRTHERVLKRLLALETGKILAQ
ncbi:hypothetical protein LTR37_006730 [Vermiconidia calcicola]|uniref:Uncharacterized protein n=1 Tax=Vermiconidia calcicola TaxID=1690605 RepID=A0ACC3NFQ2_9PEZI|nr:hypothetical protein LTR37_006730 [Vermiconidia calcicola]